jgi:hypothetical protein
MGGKAGKSNIVIVPLDKIQQVCHECGKVRESTRKRTMYTKNYEGPCGDSFCYATCDMDACRPVSKTVCDKCADKLAHARYKY